MVTCPAEPFRRAGLFRSPIPGIDRGALALFRGPRPPERLHAFKSPVQQQAVYIGLSLVPDRNPVIKNTKNVRSISLPACLAECRHTVQNRFLLFAGRPQGKPGYPLVQV